MEFFLLFFVSSSILLVISMSFLICSFFFSSSLLLYWAEEEKVISRNNAECRMQNAEFANRFLFLFASIYFQHKSPKNEYCTDDGGEKFLTRGKASYQEHPLQPSAILFSASSA